MKLPATIACLLLALPAAAQETEPTWLVRRAAGAAAPAFDTLTIGETTRAAIVARLGAPSGEKERTQGWKETESCRAYGLYSIAARYDEQGVLEELELILARPLELWMVEGDIRVHLPTERSDVSEDPSVPVERLVYADAGVRLLVARERVVAIQLFAPTGAPSVDLRRSLCIIDSQCRPDSSALGMRGIAVFATLQTDGSAEAIVTATVRLRTRDGRPILRARSSEPFRVAARERVFAAGGNDSHIELFVPYNALDRQSGRRGPAILTLEAECNGLSSCAETVVALPPGRNPPVLAQMRIVDQRVTVSPERVHVVVETDRLQRQTMSAQISVREPGSDRARDVGGSRTETTREFRDVRGFEIALDAVAAEAGADPVVLRSTVECAGLRAFAEMECVLAPPTDGNTGEGLTCSIEVIQPAGEMLAHPYTDRLDSRPHTLPFEVQVQGLPAGLRSLRLAIDDAGERTLWCRVQGDRTAAVFRGEVPLPLGPYRITLTLPDATATPPVLLEGDLPGYPYAPTREDLDEWAAYIAGWQERGKDLAVAWGLCNLGRDYYLIGLLDEAQESFDRAIASQGRGGGDPERFRFACRLLARIHLLRGDAAAMNAACERFAQSNPSEDDRASFTFEWATSLALLEADVSAARRLWVDAVRQAAQAGAEVPPTPAWAEE